MSHADVVIVGGGAAGLATAWHLARRPDAGRVVLVERNRLLAAESSALNAAILRTFDADEVTTRIALRSAAFLREPPEGFAGVPLVDARGLVLLAPPHEADELRRQAEAFAPELRFEWVDREALKRIHPAAHPAGAGGVYVPDDGQIDIAALMAGFAAGARAGGVEIRQGVQVDSLMAGHGRVHGVELTDGSHINALKVVIASGGWAADLGNRAGSRVRLRVTRRHLLVTRPSGSVDDRWPVLWQLGNDAFYARPESGGMLLCGCDLSDADPDDFGRDEAVRETIARKTARYLPGLEGLGMGQFWCGLRTLTADGRFVIGPDPEIEGLHWAAGLAGAGMVCAAEVGRIAASTILGDAAKDEAEAAERAALSPGRPMVLGIGGPSAAEA